jgi:hypothetical protein
MIFFNFIAARKFFATSACFFTIFFSPLVRYFGGRLLESMEFQNQNVQLGQVRKSLIINQLTQHKIQSSPLRALELGQKNIFIIGFSVLAFSLRATFRKRSFYVFFLQFFLSFFASGDF